MELQYEALSRKTIKAMPTQGVYTDNGNEVPQCILNPGTPSAWSKALNMTGRQSNVNRKGTPLTISWNDTPLTMIRKRLRHQPEATP